MSQKSDTKRMMDMAEVLYQQGCVPLPPSFINAAAELNDELNMLREVFGKITGDIREKPEHPDERDCAAMVEAGRKFKDKFDLTALNDEERAALMIIFVMGLLGMGILSTAMGLFPGSTNFVAACRPMDFNPEPDETSATRH